MNTLLVKTAVFAAVVTALTRPVAAQDDAQKLYESGKYQEVVERTSSETAPEARYLKALAHRKLDQNEQAKGAFRQLAEAGDAWRAVGESGVALADGNVDEAVNAARTAVERNAELPQAQFQLGQALDAKGENAPAAEAFAKAAERAPQMAYAHYQAGMSFYKAKRIDQMAVYFENFLKLAPNAPESPAVQSIMKTVRGR
jgi:tetratricopeptide (TPR) repeat protein